MNVKFVNIIEQFVHRIVFDVGLMRFMEMLIMIRTTGLKLHPFKSQYKRSIFFLKRFNEKAKYKFHLKYFSLVPRNVKRLKIINLKITLT